MLNIDFRETIIDTNAKTSKKKTKKKVEKKKTCKIF